MDEIEKARQKVIDAARLLVANWENPHPAGTEKALREIHQAVYELDNLQPAGWGS